MTINELFSIISEKFMNFFYYLGNTPIEDLFRSLIFIFFGLVIFGIIVVVIFYTILGIILLYLVLKKTLFDKIFPKKDKTQIISLEKQKMYKLGQKIKKLFNKN
jgi:hypothetical protein